MSFEIGWPEEESYSSEIDDKTTELKSMVVQYVGNRLSPEDDNVTLEMVIEVLADEFPEVVLALAEENFLRGYEQGTRDVSTF
tara:strand:- start:11329 stop:11577 length:249 start_codon:yes stop_codon:yes gene_type:complete